MATYYRVNLRDKENNIVYPNIHNSISIDNKTGAITSPGGFIGNASSSTLIYSLETNPTIAATYYLTFMTEKTSQNKQIRHNDGMSYYTREGTTSQKGYACLILGNNIAENTNLNKQGFLRFQSSSTGWGEISQKGAITENLYHYLPTTGGTFLNSNTYMNYALPLTGGKLTGHLYLDGAKSNVGESTSTLFFGNPSQHYASIASNTVGDVVIKAGTDSINYALAFRHGNCFSPADNNITALLGSEDHYWNSTYTNYISSKTLLLNREKGESGGRISFYSKEYDTWFLYMTNSQIANSAPNNRQPSSYGNVTTWALRSFIENSANYGWIWESGHDSKYGQDTSINPMMALSSVNGNLYVRGTITAPYFDGKALKDGNGNTITSTYVPYSRGFGVNLENYSTTNCNNLSYVRTFYAKNNGTGYCSFTQDHPVFQMAYSDNWKTQFITDWRTNLSFTRVCTNGTWSQWGSLTCSLNASVRNFYVIPINTWNSWYSGYVNGTVAFCY